MMIFKKKLVYYGFGFLMGCLLVSMIMNAKKSNRPCREAKYSVCIEELLNSPRAVDRYEALFFNETDEKGNVCRTLVFSLEGIGYVRVEELLDRERLIGRKLYYGDRVEVVFEGEVDEALIQQLVASCRMSILKKEGNTYTLQLPSHSIQALDLARKQLSDCVEGIMLVRPVRIEKKI